MKGIPSNLPKPTIEKVEKHKMNSVKLVLSVTSRAVIGIAVICLANPLWGQPAWQACGSNLCSPTSAYVGIGTSNPVNRFVVQGGGIGLGVTTGNVIATVLDSASPRGVSLGYDTSGTIGIVAGTSAGGPSQLAFWNANSSGTWGEKMRIDPSGNVGIGTTSPAAKLHVSGTNPLVRLTAPSGNWAGIQFELSALTTPVRWALYTGSSGQPGSSISFFDYVTLTDRFTITSTGNVGIGTSAPQYKLAVSGTIGAKEVIVTNTGWADFVFKPDYLLKPLNEVAAYIQENHHLPDIPSETEVQEKGVSLGEMQVKLLAKIEELTLRMIQQDEENRQLRERIAHLEADHGTRP
jgi:hypothetical protein